MIINRNSWHAKLWNFYCDLPWGERSLEERENTNLCTYVRSICLWLPLSVIFFGSLMLGGAAVYALIAFPILVLIKLIVGGRPTGIGPDDFVRYKGLSVGSYELYPWHFLLVIAAVVAPLWLSTKWGGVIDGSIFAFLLLYLAVWKTSALSIFKDWFVAKKQGVCPLIEFE